MNIKVSGTIEEAIRTAVESGQFSSAQAFLEAATTEYLHRTVLESKQQRPSAAEMKERFRSFRGKLRMTRDEIVAARHDGLA